MLDKGKISTVQMAYMLYATVIGTVILSVPATIGKYAKNDLWLSPIWACLAGIFAVFAACQLHKFYPNLTLIQYLPRIIGRFPGKLLGLTYLYFYLDLNGHGIRLYADFIVSSSLPRTPIVVVVGTMVFLCCVAARGGIEGIGRATQIIIPFSVVMFVLLIAFLVPEFEVLQLLPILENGIVPSLKGAITPQGWFAEELLITFMLPLLSDANNAMKWGNISVISVMLTLVVTNLTILFMYGTDLSRYTYPLLSAVRYVSFADFFENVEAAIVAIWILGNFIKFTFIHYAIVIGTAQLLNLSDYRPIVWPMGLITCLISFWSLPNQMVLTQYSTFVFPHYSLMYQTILPLMLLLVAAWRTRTRNPKGEPLS